MLRKWMAGIGNGKNKAKIVFDTCLDNQHNRPMLRIEDEIIERLQTVKDARRMSQEGLARDIGVSSRTIFRWLKGASRPSDMARMALEKYLKKGVV